MDLVYFKDFRLQVKEMGDNRSTVVSVRLSREIVEWVNQHGGSSLIKSLIYSYIAAQTIGTGNGKRAQLLQSLVEESLDKVTPPPPEIDDELQPSMQFD